MGRSLALVVLLAACSPGPPSSPDATGSGGSGSGSAADPNDGAVSGSRLKLTWYAFSDGTRQWSGLYDSERKEYCSPYEGAWPDGNSYCVPDSSGNNVVFSDAGCTQPEVDEYVGSTCAAAASRYALDETYDNCSEQYLPSHLYLVGTPLSATSYYEQLSDGSCAMFTVDPSFEQLYTASSEVMTSDLVQLTLSAPEGSGSLGVRSWESSDGAKLPAHLTDAVNGLDCTPEYYGDSASTAACAPTDAFDAYLDRDAACEQPALDVTSTCAAPPYAYTYPQTSCPSDLASYFAVGAKLASPSLYESFGTTCEAATADPTESYYQLGGALSLAQLQRTPDTDGSHRIQIIHYDNAAGLHFRDPTYLYDSQEQAVCVPEQLADGSTRCVPDSGTDVTTGYYFTASSCTATSAIDVVDIYTGPATCTAPTLPAYVRKYVTSTGCEASFELHQLASKISTSLYYLDGTTCTKYTPFEEVFYGIGPAISTNDFESAAIATDN